MEKRIGWRILVALGVGSFALIGAAGDLAPKLAMEQPDGAILSSAVQSDAAEIYAKNCVMCHGEEGKGDGPAAAALDPSPSDLTDAEIIGALSDEELLEVLSKGKGSMPGYGSMLKAEELKALAEYVRSLSAGEN